MPERTGDKSTDESARPEVVAVAAVARNGVIGAAGGIPWHLPGDLPRFKRLTLGHVIIMGRKTYESIGRPLPGRITIVITRNPDWSAEGIELAHSWEDARRSAIAQDLGGPIFVVGGGDIYRAAWPDLDRLEITDVEQAPDGDATFPAIDPKTWIETYRDEEHDGFAWVTYRRTYRSSPTSAKN